MHLSCSRCRARKLKCDREEPACKRCQVSEEECIYPERKKFKRVSQRGRINRLDRRLEFLEERLSGHLRPVDVKHAAATSSTTPTRSPGVTRDAESPTETWIYHTVRRAKKKIESRGEYQSTMSAMSTQTTVTNAVRRLDTTLDQLAVASPTLGSHPVHNTMEIKDAVRYIEAFIKCLPSLNFFAPFQHMLDAEFWRSLPYIINSPHAQVSPAVRVVYLNAIYRGQTFGTADEYKRASSTYFICLQSVPLWLSSAEGSHMDLIAATLTAWTAIDNFDYHLGWKFHSEACRFSSILGIHDVDIPESKLAKEEIRSDFSRQLHWCLVTTDFFFRLWYDKPSALRCSISQVNLPAEISPRVNQPKFSNSILFIVWSRVLFLLEEFYKLPIETAKETELPVKEKAGNYCTQLEDLLLDWDLLSIARSPRLHPFVSWIFVDSIVAMNSFIIYMRRKISHGDQTVHPQALRSARTILSIIIEWFERDMSGERAGLHMQLATFYPFCAFFTVYNHISCSRDPSEYETDIQMLEKIAHKMVRVASIRTEFVPLADAMNAMNEVSRAVHSDPIDGQTEPQPCQAENKSQASSLPYTSSIPESGHNQQYRAYNWNQQVQSTVKPQGSPSTSSLYNVCSALPPHMGDQNGVFNSPFQLETPWAHNPAPLGRSMAPSTNRNEIAEGFAQPLEYFRAMENNLIWRDWHEDWWNLSPGKI